MSPYENAKFVSIDLARGAKLYFLKSLSLNDFKTLWQNACAKERGKATPSKRALVLQENVVEANLGDASPFHKATRGYQKHKRKEPSEAPEQNEASTDDGSTNKEKKRVVWAGQVHSKFMEATEQLGGLDKAVPKKILELMNVPGLTRESVASHLQKQRRAVATYPSASSIYGIDLTTHPKLTSLPSIQNSNSSWGNHLSSSNFSQLFHPEASTSTSNLGQEPYGLLVSSLGATTQNNSNLFSFRTAQNSSQPGLDQLNPRLVLESRVDQNCGTTMIVSGNENGGSSSNPYQAPSSNANSSFVGFRLAGNGKLVESGQMGVLGNDEMKADEVKVTAEGTGNERSVQYPSPAIVPSMPHDLASLDADGEIDALLDVAGSTSPQIFWKGDFDDSFFNNSD